MTTPIIKVWDPFVRLFHWTLVVCFAVAWLTADKWDRLHEWAGYVVAGLIAFRLIWGLRGPKYARFTQFIRTPRTTVRYLWAIMRGREHRYLGHNPAGGAMIVVLLLTLAGSIITGWMYTLDAFWGEEWVENTHNILSTLALFLVAVHVVGVIVASFRHKENLVRAMVTGAKRSPSLSDVA